MRLQIAQGQVKENSNVCLRHLRGYYNGLFREHICNNSGVILSVDYVDKEEVINGEG